MTLQQPPSIKNGKVLIPASDKDRLRDKKKPDN